MIPSLYVSSFPGTMLLAVHSYLRQLPACPHARASQAVAPAPACTLGRANSQPQAMKQHQQLQQQLTLAQQQLKQ
jgi:hypothetical protein